MRGQVFFPFAILLFFNLSPSGAQTHTPMPIGVYQLRGVTEVASGFRFNADSSFDFYFMYGAVDRFSKGSWVQQGDSLVLNSPPKPPQGFALQKAKTVESQGIVIQVSDPNPAVLRYVLCRIQTTAGDTLQGASDENGRIVFETMAPVRTIELLHELWPDRPSAFEISDPAGNYFEFTILPTIVDVAFVNLVLHQEGKDLRGAHPLMQGEEFLYVRPD